MKRNVHGMDELVLMMDRWLLAWVGYHPFVDEAVVEQTGAHRC